ncbi:MAG: hypothetical protein EZS28_004694, partial [Streblomastix strix]
DFKGKKEKRSIDFSGINKNYGQNAGTGDFEISYIPEGETIQNDQYDNDSLNSSISNDYPTEEIKTKAAGRRPNKKDLQNFINEDEKFEWDRWAESLSDPQDGQKTDKQFYDKQYISNYQYTDGYDDENGVQIKDQPYYDTNYQSKFDENNADTTVLFTEGENYQEKKREDNFQFSVEMDQLLLDDKANLLEFGDSLSDIQKELNSKASLFVKVVLEDTEGNTKRISDANNIHIDEVFEFEFDPKKQHDRLCLVELWADSPQDSGREKEQEILLGQMALPV